MGRQCRAWLAPWTRGQRSPREGLGIECRLRPVLTPVRGLEQDTGMSYADGGGSFQGRQKRCQYAEHACSNPQRGQEALPTPIPGTVWHKWPAMEQCRLRSLPMPWPTARRWCSARPHFCAISGPLEVTPGDSRRVLAPTRESLAKFSLEICSKFLASFSGGS